MPFLSAHGGIGSAAVVVGGEGREVYFMGIIDILTIYSLQKYVENRYKRARLQKGISAVSPRKYAERFKAFIAAGITVVDQHTSTYTRTANAAGKEGSSTAIAAKAAPLAPGPAPTASEQQLNGQPTR